MEESLEGDNDADTVLGIKNLAVKAVKALSKVLNETGYEIVDYTVAPIFMKNKNGYIYLEINLYEQLVIYLIYFSTLFKLK